MYKEMRLSPEAEKYRKWSLSKWVISSRTQKKEQLGYEFLLLHSHLVPRLMLEL